MSIQVALRPAAADDEAFLRDLYIDAHPEFAQLPSPASTQVVDLQLAAQRSQYRAAHPAAVDHVLESGGVPVGRCWTDLSPTTLRVLDLAVLQRYRRQGIAGGVLAQLRARADAACLTVRLTVWAANTAARRLYLSAGLVPDGETNGYLQMSRPAPDPVVTARRAAVPASTYR